MKRKQVYFSVFYFTLLWGIQVVRLQRFIADDSYFYLVIARNIVLTGKQTFLGIFLTNGAHPLWLYLLSGWYWLLRQVCFQCLYDLAGILPISWALLAAGVWASWQVAGKLEITPLLFTSLPLGFLSALNLLGSEAFACYASLSILAWLALDTRMERWRWALALGLACAAVFLARLDMVFFVGVFYIWLWLRCRNIRLWGMAAVMTCVPALIYVLSNMWFFGGITPVSGWLKTTFPILSIDGLAIDKLGTELSGYNLFFGIAPIGLATLLLPALRSKLRGDASLLYVFWGGSVLHFMYTAGFSRGATGRLWYYVLPVMLGTLVLALAIKYYVSAVQQARVARVLVGLAACFFLAYTVRTQVRLLPPTEGEIVLAYLSANQIEDETILVADVPGEVAFFSTNRVIALDMLTANRRFVGEMLAAPNSLQYIFDQAALAGQPVAYVLLTTGTWLGTL